MPERFGTNESTYDALRQLTLAMASGGQPGSSVPAAGSLGNKILLFRADASALIEYDPTDAGLTTALAAAVSGDTVWLPSMTISGNHTVAAGIQVQAIQRRAAILTGQVTLSAGSSLQGLTITRTANDASTLIGVVGPSTGTAYIYDCNIAANQAGAGTGYALSAQTGGTLIHYFCVLSAQSAGADSNPLNRSATTYAAGAEISTGAITVTDSGGATIGSLTPGTWYAVEAFNGPWDRGPDYNAEYTYRVSSDGGTTWLPSPGGYYLGMDFAGEMHLDLPTWAAYAEVVSTNYARIYFQATTTSIKIRVGEDGLWTDNTGTLSWRLRSATVTVGAVIEGYASDIINTTGRVSMVPRWGDRAAFDALNYQIRHANDIGATSGIHHTLDELDLRYGSSQLPWLIPSPDGGVGSEADPYTDSVDNAAGIQTAIDMLATDRGGAVVLRSARYNVTAAGGLTIITPSIKLFGVVSGFNIDPNGQSEGISGTKIYLTGDGIGLGVAAQKRGGIVLEDLYLWGGTGLPASKAAIFNNQATDQAVLNRIRVGGGWTYGLYVNGIFDAPHLFQWAILGITHGVYLASSADCPYATFVDMQIDDNTGYGFYADPTANASDHRYLRLSSCTLTRNAYGGTISDPCNVYWGLTQSTIEGCAIRAAGYDLINNTTVANCDGIIVDGNYNIIDGNQLLDNSGYGIRIKGDYNIIIGNLFANNTVGNILIEAGATGNIIVQPGLTGITDNGTGTVYVGTMTSIAAGTGISATPDPITTTGTLALDAALNDLNDVDTTGTASGDIIYNSGAGWVDYPLGIGTKVTVSGNKIRFGDVSGGNYLEIDTATGNVRLMGDATAWEDLRVEPNARTTGAKAPTFTNYKNGVYLYYFDNALAAAEKEIFFNMQMPHAWLLESDIHIHVHWIAITTGSADEKVRWGLEYTKANVNSVFGATDTIYAEDPEDPPSTTPTADTHYLSEFSAIDMTGDELSTVLICRLFRNSSHANDTYGGTAGLLYIDAHYQVDSFGSDEELVKDASAALLLESGDILLLETGDRLLLE